MSTPTEHILSTHVTCFGCDYDLIGLDQRLICPECAEPIHETLAHLPTTQLGARTTAAIRFGAWFILLATPIGLAICLAAIALCAWYEPPDWIWAPTIAVLFTTWFLALAAGWWIVVTPSGVPFHQVPPDRRPSARRRTLLCWATRAADIALVLTFIPWWIVGWQAFNTPFFARSPFNGGVWETLWAITLTLWTLRTYGSFWIVRTTLPRARRKLITVAMIGFPLVTVPFLIEMLHDLHGNGALVSLIAVIICQICSLGALRRLKLRMTPAADADTSTPPSPTNQPT